MVPFKIPFKLKGRFPVMQWTPFLAVAGEVSSPKTLQLCVLWILTIGSLMSAPTLIVVANEDTPAKQIITSTVRPVTGARTSRGRRFTNDFINTSGILNAEG
jgi:hypothetical protein